MLPFVAAAVTIACVFFACLFMDAYKRESHLRAFCLKGAAAVCFVLIALTLQPASFNPAYAKLVLTGLIFGLCGDELLHLRFLFSGFHDLLFAVGAGFFAVGHFFYMKALYDLGEIPLGFLVPILLAGFLAGYLYGKKQGSNAGPLQFAAVGYMALVIFMGAVTVAAFLAAPSPALFLFAFGGVLFGCSDNILLAFCFGKNPAWSQNILVHITYYAAQILIAWSILLI